MLYFIVGLLLAITFVALLIANKAFQQATVAIVVIAAIGIWFNNYQADKKKQISDAAEAARQKSEEEQNIKTEKYLDGLVLLWHILVGAFSDIAAAIWAKQRWRSGEVVNDGLPDSWEAGLRWRAVDSFFSVPQ